MSTPTLATVAVRAHAQPPGWKPKPARRGKAPWPELALLFTTVPHARAGEPLRFGVCAILPATVEGVEPVAVRLIYPEDASSEDRETLAAVARAHGLGEPISLSAFGERLFRKVYKERLPLVGYSLPAQIARIASDWTDGEAGSFSFILWTRPCPPGRRSRGERERRPKLRNGEIENGNRPRIAINPLDGQRSSIRFHGRGRPDAEDVVPEGESKHKEGSKYVFPGHFVDLQRLASALSGKRVTSTAEAYVRFGLEPVISPAPQSGALTPETVDAALDELHGLARLYQRLLTTHRAQIGCSAQTESAPDASSMARKKTRSRPSLKPDEIYSPASYAQGVFEAVGLNLPLVAFPDLPKSVLGKTMAAFFGGDCAASVRHVPKLPVSYLDVTSEYPVCAHLIGGFELLRASRIEVVQEDPEELRAFLASLTVERLLTEPALWIRLGRTFVDLIPRGDVLPHRVPNGKAWLLEISPLRFDEPLPFSLADVTSVLETGRVPEIVSGFSLQPHGCQRLSPLTLPSGRVLDPDSDDLFLALAEERLMLGRRGDLPAWQQKQQSGLLKLTVNAACFGLPCQVNVRETSSDSQDADVVGPDGKERCVKVDAIEEPGRWYFPPLAAGVAAAGRLMLEVARLLVEEAGGSVAYRDTDSLCILSTPEGGQVPCPGGREYLADGTPAAHALSYVEIEQAVRAPFERLSPYDPELNPDAGPFLLGLEPENFSGDPPRRRQLRLDVTASKSYELYALSEAGEENAPDLELVKVSEHGLGHLLDPRDPESGDTGWIAEGKEHLLRAEIELLTFEPEWFPEPALSVVALNRPSELARLARIFKDKRAVWPYARLAVAHPLPLYARDEKGERRTPVAPFHAGFDPAAASWCALVNGEPLRLRIAGEILGEADLRVEPGRVLCGSVGEALRRDHRRTEKKALAADGAPCRAGTVGLLTPAPTDAYRVVLIGKETRNLERASVTEDPVTTLYSDVEEDAWQKAFLPVLGDLAARSKGGVSGLARRHRIPLATLRRALAGKKVRQSTRARLAELAASLACEELRAANPGLALPYDPEQVCQIYRRSFGELVARVCGGCGERLRGKQRRWCSERCRVRARRDRAYERTARGVNRGDAPRNYTAANLSLRALERSSTG